MLWLVSLEKFLGEVTNSRLQVLCEKRFFTQFCGKILMYKCLSLKKLQFWILWKFSEQIFCRAPPAGCSEIIYFEKKIFF